MRDIRTTIDIGIEGISWPVITDSEHNNEKCGCNEGCKYFCPNIPIL